MAIIEKIATKAPIAIERIIESVNVYFNHTVDGFAFEVNTFGETAETEDFKEGASAFIERRKPNFIGK